MGAELSKVAFGDKAAKQKYQADAEIAYSNDDPVPQLSAKELGAVGVLKKAVDPESGGLDFRKVKNAADGMSQMVAGEQRLGKGDMAFLRDRQNNSGRRPINLGTNTLMAGEQTGTKRLLGG